MKIPPAYANNAIRFREHSPTCRNLSKSAAQANSMRGCIASQAKEDHSLDTGTSKSACFHALVQSELEVLVKIDLNGRAETAVVLLVRRELYGFAVEPGVQFRDEMSGGTPPSIVKRFDGSWQFRVHQAEHTAAFAQPTTDIKYRVFVVWIPVLGHFLLRRCL